MHQFVSKFLSIVYRNLSIIRYQSNYRCFRMHMYRKGIEYESKCTESITFIAKQIKKINFYQKNFETSISTRSKLVHSTLKS